MITRRATIADARPIAALQLRAWWRNYQDIIDPHRLLAADDDARTAHWTDALTVAGAETYVAEVAGQVCGFATVGLSREAAATPAEGEVWALYVDPPAQGAGVGTVLLADAEQALRTAGHSAAVLRTLRDNGLARAFFERSGWSSVDGSVVLQHWDAPHVLYRRTL